MIPLDCDGTDCMNTNPTQVIQQSLPVEAFLECAHGEAPDKTLIDHLPFTIGRVEECDLTIDSIQVSREHATLYKAGHEIRIRDNGSTNGTFVNGQRLGDVVLSDGDIVTVADFELSYRMPSASSGKAAVATQVIEQRLTDSSDGMDRNATHAADLRRLQEMLTHGCVECGLRPLVDLQTNELVGVEADATWPYQATSRRALERVLHEEGSSMSEHLLTLEYMAAGEEFDGLADLQYLILPAGPDTVDSPKFHRLWENLAVAHTGESRLVIEIHDPSPRNAAGLASLIDTLHACGVLVGFAATSPSTSQLRDFLEAGTDFIKLAEGLITELHQHRQRERQVEAAVELCHSLGAKAIASGVNCGKEAEACRNLNCDFASGAYFGVSLPRNTDSSVYEPLSAAAP